MVTEASEDSVQQVPGPVQRVRCCGVYRDRKVSGENYGTIDWYSTNYGGQSSRSTRCVMPDLEEVI